MYYYGEVDSAVGLFIQFTYFKHVQCVHSWQYHNYTYLCSSYVYYTTRLTVCHNVSHLYILHSRPCDSITLSHAMPYIYSHGIHTITIKLHMSLSRITGQPETGTTITQLDCCAVEGIPTEAVHTPVHNTVAVHNRSCLYTYSRTHEHITGYNSLKWGSLLPSRSKPSSACRALVQSSSLVWGNSNTH